jgi:hypothetical protein
MYIHIFIYIYIQYYLSKASFETLKGLYIHVYTSIHIHIYTHTYVCIYICIYIHIHINKPVKRLFGYIEGLIEIRHDLSDIDNYEDLHIYEYKSLFMYSRMNYALTNILIAHNCIYTYIFMYIRIRI